MLRRSNLLLLFSLLIFVSFGFTIYVGFQPGLNNPEAIGKYLNGNLPTVSPNSGTTYEPIDAFPNLKFKDPLVILSHPSQDLLLVSSWDGLIHYFDNDPNTSQKFVFSDLRDRVFKARGGGLLGMAFHPQFGQAGNNNIYVYYAAKGNSGQAEPIGFDPYTCVDDARFYGTYMRLSRFEVNSNFTINKSSELKMINFRLMNNSHRGGGMVFGDDGFLYLTIGDQSRYTTSQNITNYFEGGTYPSAFS